MNKVGFKKYTIFLFVCFFALVGIVSARDPRIQTLEMTFGTTLSFGRDYVGLECNTDGLVLFDVKKKPKMKVRLILGVWVWGDLLSSSLLEQVIFFK